MEEGDEPLLQDRSGGRRCGRVPGSVRHGESTLARTCGSLDRARPVLVGRAVLPVRLPAGRGGRPGLRAAEPGHPGAGAAKLLVLLPPIERVLPVRVGMPRWLGARYPAAPGARGSAFTRSALTGGSSAGVLSACLVCVSFRVVGLARS